ncbi:AsmA-like C-terminal region-containing protein [uncultured Rikenella sp.]|uniref:AsmA family protein n=1 Tax=uncultured Rikenella sp. TaxID=368003 RepID=UPI00261E042B|nr:AsmA-like C-terminal region-containing protein [uncultured Rikenella sp.]
MKRKTLRKLIFIPLGIIILLFGLAVGAAALLLTPQRLIPLVSQICDRYLDAQVRFDTVSISLFRDFPYITLRLRGAEVISHAFDRLPDTLSHTMPAEADTLAHIGRLDVSLNAISLISGKADIRRIGLDNAHLHAYVAPDGTANWDIYQSDPAAADTDSTSFEIHIDRILIRNGLHLVYDNRPDRITGSVKLKNFFVRGRLSSDLLQNDIRRLRLRDCTVAVAADGKTGAATIDSLTVDSRRSVDYTLKLAAKEAEWPGIRRIDSVRLNTAVLFHGKDHREMTVREFALRLNDMLVTAEGEAAFCGDSIVTDFGLQTRRLSIAGLLKLVPTEILPLARDYETDLTTDLDLRIDGTCNPSDGTWPDITVDWRIPAGYLYYVKDRNGSRIDTLALDATLRYRPRCPDSTGIDLRRFQVSGIGLNLYAQGTLDRLTGDAGFAGAVKGDLSLDYLTKHFPSSSGTTVRGRIAMDLKGRARLSQLDLGRIGGARIGGRLTVDTLLVNIPKEDFRLMVGHGRLGMGTGLTRTDSLMAEGTQAVGAMLMLDTVDMDMGSALCVTGKKIEVHAATSAKNIVHDTTAVHPSRGVLSAAGLRVAMGDSTVLIGRGMDSRWSILPAADDPRVPRMALQMQARRLSLRETDSRFVIRQGSVGLDATLYRPDSARLRRREQRLDSLQRLYPAVARDSLFAHARALREGRQGRPNDGVSDSDLDMKVSSELGDLLRRWQVNGSVKASAGRIVTPYFPLATALRDVDITFNTDEVRLNRTFIKAGQSQMVLTGDVAGLRRAMLGRGRIRGNMKVEADTLNLNEIVRVANAGAELVAQGGVGHTESDDQLEQRIAQSADTASVGTLLVVPGNIDMTFDMTVHHGVYGNLALDSLAGEVIVRNRMIRLSDLAMRSNAGNLRMTGLYATRTLQDIQTGFDLEMERMQVARLIELIPSIDTLMPMLRSFEGVVNCQIAVTARLDSAMNILLPSLNAACHIEGDSLVLMDGETFAEISKKLMFKNKKRNLIDHISAELLVRDAQIEIFPFVVEIDRYRAAVSGVHKMDMTFDYHISVLKSPIPFRLGIDIFGDLEDFDFRITRARYKNANLPTRVELIEDTRMNLRNYIRDIFLRGPRAEEKLRITPETESPTELLPAADSLSAADTAGLETLERSIGE